MKFHHFKDAFLKKSLAKNFRFWAFYLFHGCINSDYQNLIQKFQYNNHKSWKSFWERFGKHFFQKGFSKNQGLLKKTSWIITFYYWNNMQQKTIFASISLMIHFRQGKCLKAFGQIISTANIKYLLLTYKVSSEIIYEK